MDNFKLKNIVKGIFENSDIKKPRWCAIILDDESHNKLTSFFRNNFSKLDNWDIISHHMTVDPFNPLTSKDIDKIGKKYTLTVTEVGLSKLACAVKVEGYDGETNNKFPHVTLAINRDIGGKPKDSNDVSKWKPLHITDQIELNGVAENL